MGRLREAKSLLTEAAKLRGCYDDAAPEIPVELLEQAPVVVYTADPVSLGAPKADRNELEAIIDAIPELPETARTRVKEDAGIIRRNLLDRMMEDVKEYGTEE